MHYPTIYVSPPPNFLASLKEEYQQREVTLS